MAQHKQVKMRAMGKRLSVLLAAFVTIAFLAYLATTRSDRSVSNDTPRGTLCGAEGERISAQDRSDELPRLEAPDEARARRSALGSKASETESLERMAHFVLSPTVTCASTPNTARVRLTQDGRSHEVSVPLGRVVSRPVGEDGVLLLELVDSLWLQQGRSHVLSPAPEPAEVRIEPSGLISGRVLNAATGEALTQFEIRWEAFLDPERTTRYVGSPDSFVAPDGNFCIVPRQCGFAHLLRISAPGYASIETDWIDYPDATGHVALGELLMTPEEIAHLHVWVLDRTTGTPIEGAEILALAAEGGKAGLMIADGKIRGRVLALSKIAREVTSQDGEVIIATSANQPLQIAAWAPGYQLLSRTIGTSNLQGEGGRSVLLELESGAAMDVLVLLGPEQLTLDGSLRLEVGPPGWSQFSLPRAADTGVVSLRANGLTPGPADLRLVARVRGAVTGRPRDFVLARETLHLVAKEELRVVIDLSEASPAGSLRGEVLLPYGVEFDYVWIAQIRRDGPALPQRLSRVVDRRFQLSLAPGDGWVVLRGSADADSIAVVCVVERSSLDPGSWLRIDASKPLVRGHMNDISHLPLEEVVISPGQSHPLFGVDAATLELYPSAGGNFMIYGLAPGEWRAVGRYSRRATEFVIREEDAIDIYLTEQR